MDNTTAKVSCFARAYHYENNKEPIFADSIAKKLLGDDYDQIAESMIQGINFFLPGYKGTKEEGLRLIVDKQLSPSVLGRNAYCEKKLLDKSMNGYRMDRTILTSKDMQMILAGLRGLAEKATTGRLWKSSAQAPSQKQMMEAFLFEHEYADDEGLLAWMLSCRDKATVLEPERIREKLYQNTSEITKRYEGERK